MNTPTILQRFWNHNLLSDMLNHCIILLTVLFYMSAFTILGLSLAENDGFLFLPTLLFGVPILLLIYAIARFYPDLISVFVAIEANTRPKSLDLEPARYRFLQAGRVVFRVLSLGTLLLLILLLIMSVFDRMERASGFWNYSTGLWRQYLYFVQAPWLQYSNRIVLDAFTCISRLVFLLPLPFVSMILLVCSDATSLPLNIERNSRPFGSSESHAPSSRLRILRIVRKIVLVSLVVLAIAFMAAYRGIPENRMEMRLYGGPYATPSWIMVSTCLGFFFLIGLVGDLAEFFLQWEVNTRSNTDRPTLGFLALRHFMRWQYVLGGLVFAAALALAILSLVQARSVTNAILGFLTWVGYGSLLLFFLTFLAALAKSILRIEANLRPDAASPDLIGPSFIGLRLISKLMRLLAIVIAIGFPVGSLVTLIMSANREPAMFLLPIGGFVLGYVTYVILGSLPDLLRCLMKIEEHCRKAAVSNVESGG